MDEHDAEALLEVAEEARAALVGLDVKAAFERLEQLHHDLLQALEWFIEQRRTDDASRLAVALTPFWTATKRLEEGTAWFERVHALPHGDDARRGRASFEAGMLAFWQGNDDRSTDLHERALELGRRANDPTVTALALGGLARVVLRAGEVDEARRLCQEALAVSDGTHDRAGRSGALHVLGVAAQMAGDLEEARRRMAERLALMRELGNYAGISSEGGNLSMVERQLGNVGGAEALVREALQIDRRRGDELPVPWRLSGLAAIATERGELERAATLVGAAEQMLEEQGAAWPPDERPHFERNVAALAEAMDPADFDRARAAGRSMSSSDAVDFALGSD